MKIISLALVSLLITLLLPISDLRAQYYLDRQQLAKVKTVSISIIDGVKDGCLPRPNALKTEAELILRQAGISIDDAGGHSPYAMNIAANGWEITYRGGQPSGNCVGALIINMSSGVALNDGSYVLARVFDMGGVYGGPKGQFQAQLREALSEIIAELANEILKARTKSPRKAE